MYYLSFVKSGRPPGQGCVGVTVVDGNTLPEAMAEANRLGVNPGGEVAVWKLDVESINDLPPEARKFYQRLVSGDEMRAAGERTIGQIEETDPDYAAKIGHAAGHVCLGCNECMP